MFHNWTWKKFMNYIHIAAQKVMNGWNIPKMNVVSNVRIKFAFYIRYIIMSWNILYLLSINYGQLDLLPSNTSKSTYFSILQCQYYFQTCGQAALGMLCGSDPTNPHPSISLYCLSAASEKEDHHLAKLALAEARIHPGKL